jgi:quinohemoprotein amine dehydrogenase beta subunit
MTYLGRMAIAIAVGWSVAVGWSADVAAKEYLLTGAKPDQLFLIDPAARTVERAYTIPDAAPGPLTIAAAPDGKVAYAIVNRWESVSGIDLDTGKEVFRADFSIGDMRVKAMFGMEISPDGKELYVFLSPVRIHPGEFEVQDTYIAVYDTAGGINAAPVRTFKAPRRTAVLAFAKDGSKLYAVSWDIYALDPATGEIVDTLKVRNWGRENYSEPDVLDVWPQFEQAGVFSTPYYAVRTDRAADDPSAYRTGLLTLDLETGDFEIEDFEDTANVIFSSVVNPVRRNEVYMVYTTLAKVDRTTHQLIQRIDLDHTYYSVNVSGDGTEIYVAGTMDDIAVYRTDTLERVGTIRIPSGNDMALASIRVINR